MLIFCSEVGEEGEEADGADAVDVDGGERGERIGGIRLDIDTDWRCGF